MSDDKGLGDTIKRVTRFFGFKPCGTCKKRAEKLNEKVPYKNVKDNAATVGR